MNNTLYEIWQGLTPLLLLVIGYFLKDVHSQLKASIQQQKTDTTKLQQELNELKTSLPLNYVLREDYIRTTASMENKLDRLIDYIKSR